MAKSLRTWDEQYLNIREEAVEVEALDSKLRDVSFLPQRVQNECSNGYQWLTIVRSGNTGKLRSSHKSSGTLCSHMYWSR